MHLFNVYISCILIVCLAVSRAKNIARQADIVAALTLEVLQGSIAPFDPGMYYHNLLCNQLCCDIPQMYTAPGHTVVNS